MLNQYVKFVKSLSISQNLYFLTQTLPTIIIMHYLSRANFDLLYLILAVGISDSLHPRY